MNSSLETTEKVLSRTANFFAGVGGFFIFLMMLHICADVFLKYVFSSPIDGTLEIVSAFYMTTIVFAPLMAVTLFEGHISVTLFTAVLKPRSVKVAILIVSLFCVLITAYMTYAGIDQALRKMASGESWETSSGYIAIWHARWSYPIGVGLACVAFAWTSLQTYFAIKYNLEIEDGDMGLG
ncbi:MAG: TRAP transporter small permease [Marinosulfonomonas sp.]|nr:TRAP transporter small permease [Marinosulfonomonas sp.]